MFGGGFLSGALVASVVVALILWPRDGDGKGGTDGKGGAAARPEAKIVGVWQGPFSLPGLGSAGDVQFEFKDNGRWTVVGLSGLMKLAGERQGKWKVTDADGKLLLVQAADDLHPDKTFGWRITLEGSDQLTLVDPEGSAELKRKK
jgi:hypothetical protein